MRNTGCGTGWRYGWLFAIKRCIGRGAWGIVQLTGTMLGWLCYSVSTVRTDGSRLRYKILGDIRRPEENSFKPLIRVVRSMVIYRSYTTCS